MTSKPIPLPSPAPRSSRRKPIEVIGLLAVRPLSDGELKRVCRVLAAEGIKDMRPTHIFLTQDDANAVAAGEERAVPASIVRGMAPRSLRSRSPDTTLTEALAVARRRGAAVKEELLADPEMLNTADIANLLGMSEEGVRLKRKRHEILGLESAKRGIRYPAWQVLEGRQLLPALPRLLPCSATIHGDCSGSCSSATVSSVAIAPSMPSGMAKSTACWPPRRTLPPAPFPDWWPASPIRWRPGR